MAWLWLGRTGWDLVVLAVAWRELVELYMTWRWLGRTGWELVVLAVAWRELQLGAGGVATMVVLALTREAAWPWLWS